MFQFRSFSIFLIISFLFHNVAWAWPDARCLRPRPVEEREEEIEPFKDPAVIARAQAIEGRLLPILQSGEKTDEFIEELKSGRYPLDVLPVLLVIIWVTREDYERVITQADRIAAVVDDMVKENPELSSSREIKVAFEQFYTGCSAMMLIGSAKSLVSGLEVVAEIFSQYGEARKRRNIVAGLTTGSERERFLYRKYRQWIDKEVFGLRELGLLFNYNLIQPWDCVNFQVYVFRHEFQDIIEMARSNLIHAAELLKERLRERVPQTKESAVSAIVSLGILIHSESSDLERFQTDALDSALGEWGMTLVPAEDLEFLAAQYAGAEKSKALRIKDAISGVEINRQRFKAVDAAMSFGAVAALAYAIDNLNKVYHALYSEPVRVRSLKAAVLETHIHSFLYEIFKKWSDPMRQWPPNVSLTEARRIFRSPDANLRELNCIAEEIEHISGEWRKAEVGKMRLWLNRLNEIRRWKSPSLEGPMLGILYRGIIRMALATNEMEFVKELARQGDPERAAIFFYIGISTGGLAAYSKKNARECLNALIAHALSRNKEAFAEILEFMNDPDNGFYDDNSPPFKPGGLPEGLSRFEGKIIRRVKGIIACTPPSAEEVMEAYGRVRQRGLLSSV